LLEQKLLEKSPLELNPLKQNPLEQNPLEQNPLEQNPLGQTSLEQVTYEQMPLGTTSAEINIIRSNHRHRSNIDCLSFVMCSQLAMLVIGFFSFFFCCGH
jgi:hypothetical protein